MKESQSNIKKRREYNSEKIESRTPERRDRRNEFCAIPMGIEDDHAKDYPSFVIHRT